MSTGWSQTPGTFIAKQSGTSSLIIKPNTTSSNNFVNGFQSTVTSGATTVLISSSAQQQFFTGTGGQTVNLPSTTGLLTGQTYYIVNNTSGQLFIENTVSTPLLTMESDTTATFTVLQGTNVWNNEYYTPLPPTDVGGLIVGSGTNTYGNLPIGTSGQYLLCDGFSPYWGDAPLTNVNFTATGGSCSAVTATVTQVTAWTVGVDNTFSFNTGSSYFTVPLGGIYLVTASITFESRHNLYDCQCLISVNNSISWVGEFNHSPVNALGSCSVSWPHQFTINDKIRILCFQNSGSTTDVTSQPYVTWTVTGMGGLSGTIIP